MFEREVNRDNITQADVVVGIASYNEADSIAYPVEQCGLGLRKYFGDRTAVILNCDNNSPDDTESVFLNTETEVSKIYMTTPEGIAGKGYNFEMMLRKSLELNAKMLICVDADLTSITPEWVQYFGAPLEDGYDFVNPVYSRHKYDGTITNNICYPVVYGVLGYNIRQPIGGDFALSRRLMEHIIQQPWHRTTEEYGIDIFMTMNAIMGGFRIAEAGLGSKRHKPSAPKLGPMFVQVVSTAFLTVLRNYEKWSSQGEVKRPPLFGLRSLEPPQELNVDRAVIEKQAREVFSASQGVLERVLDPGVYGALVRMFSSGSIDITAEQWVRCVYDMIVGFRDEADRGNVVEAFKGLYFGRTLSFMNRTWDYSNEQAEAEILAQAELFLTMRDYLIRGLK